jgi:2-polyprenyl-3-methyl-5-hydroxy-6-metoxy-1,4-benzoquinol methylase
MTSCPICRGRLNERPRVRLNGASLTECVECQSWIYAPRPEQTAQAAIHDSAEYFDHPYFDLRRAITPALKSRCRMTFDRIGRCTDLQSLRGQRFLDIGCDTGAFAQCAREEFGVVPVGIDVAGRAVAAAQARGIEAYQTTIEQAPGQLRNFKLITAIDIVEHVSDPARFLKELGSRLAPGGFAYVETPNIRSTVYRLGARVCRVTGGQPAAIWDRLFPAQHLQYFTPRSFAAVVRGADLDARLVETRVLPQRDLATGQVVRLAVGAMQAFDRLWNDRILITAVLAKPAEGRA